MLPNPKGVNPSYLTNPEDEQFIQVFLGLRGHGLLRANQPFWESGRISTFSSIVSVQDLFVPTIARCSDPVAVSRPLGGK